jgi:hypothetical protein
LSHIKACIIFCTVNCISGWYFHIINCRAISSGKAITVITHTQSTRILAVKTGSSWRNIPMYCGESFQQQSLECRRWKLRNDST